MSEVALFAIGSVIFVITAWATIAYGLAFVHQLRMEDIETGDVHLKRESQFTDVYVSDNKASSDPAAVPRG